MKAIRISYDSGEYFVSAKSGTNFKSDSVYHDIHKAFNRAFALLDGDAKKVESERLVARVRELEAQNAELLAVLDAMLEYTADLDPMQGFEERDSAAVKKARAAIASVKGGAE